jgi:hypothetical protein
MAIHQADDSMRRWRTAEQYLVVGLCICLFLASGSVASDEAEFTFPTLKSQPAVIQKVVRAAEVYTLVVVNRSSSTIQGIAFTFAGTRCTPPYKPGWPVETRDGLKLAPGATASIGIRKSRVDAVAAGSLASCGHAMATEIVVDSVTFADGSKWDLGDRVRAGEKSETR